MRGPFFQASYCYHINESLSTKKGELLLLSLYCLRIRASILVALLITLLNERYEMELSERNKLVIARVENFNYILRTAMFVLLGTLALGVFAEISNSFLGNVHIWALSATIIGAALYGMLAGNTALNDMAALRDDMDEETKNTNYGVSVLSAPLPVFRVILLLVYLVIAATQLMMLHG